jgi:hypothetical protein
LELQAYPTTFPNFKYKPHSFVFVEIRSNSKTPTTPTIVQLVVTKLVYPFRGGIGLEILSLYVQTFYHTCLGYQCPY